MERMANTRIRVRALARVVRSSNYMRSDRCLCRRCEWCCSSPQGHVCQAPSADTWGCQDGARSDRPRPLSLGGRRDEVRAPRGEMRKGSYDGARRNEGEARHSNAPTTSRHSREESCRRSRPPTVTGPRPSPSKISATRPAPRPTPEAIKVPASRLNPMAQEFESVFQDVTLGPEPFKSVLSPDVDGGFAVGQRRWSGEDKKARASGDYSRGAISENQNATEDQTAKRSTLSPHAEPFILGSLGQPAVKPARKGKPAPLSLNNPNWQAVSSVSQPGTPGIDSPKMGQQPRVTGWFTNLFTFKPVYHVLYSTASIELTARECARVLTTFGIQVLKAEEQDVLRCNVERFNDLDGVLITKPVKFRIEVRSNSRILDSPRLDVPGTPLTGSPYPCVLVMTQEKGAHSTLKAVYARLRAMWRLDALVSPMPVTPVMA
ncbi:hypothetical protein RSAG8_06846, partial [Rhizoctonia solani AG-8 WAC10335]